MKIAPIMAAMAMRPEAFTQVLVHTGQHYDDIMSEAIFRDLRLPAPDVHFAVGSGSHAEQTARAMIGIQRVVEEHRPDMVVVVGDVNSTLAGALVCSKMGVSLTHVEAGMRSFDRRMPEEINRVVTDQLSQLLFCPAPAAIEYLRREGITQGVHLVGDVMHDALRIYLPLASEAPLPAAAADLPSGGYVLATVHRAGNTDDRGRLAKVLDCLAVVELPVVFPVHPRTVAALRSNGLSVPPNVRAIDPVGYLTMLRLEQGARAILTDSGGVQKEAFWLRIPCLTLRDRTEMTETVDSGWNHVVDVDPGLVRRAMAMPRPTQRPEPYGDGHSAERIVDVLGQYLSARERAPT